MEPNKSTALALYNEGFAYSQKNVQKVEATRRVPKMLNDAFSKLVEKVARQYEEWAKKTNATYKEGPNRDPNAPRITIHIVDSFVNQRVNGLDFLA